MNEEAKYRISMAMIKHGGSFVHHLGHALAHADMKNRLKIMEAFPDLCAEYYQIAEKDPDID